MTDITVAYTISDASGRVVAQADDFRQACRKAADLLDNKRAMLAQAARLFEIPQQLSRR